ncbi:MAG: glycosyltransferase family 39 protein [Aquisalimonadaceae bacterium]
MSSVSVREMPWLQSWAAHHVGAMEGRRHLLLLLAIICVGLVLRLNGLGAVGLYADEKYTFPAALGVLETGLPLLPSGMLYPRALLQSYLMAGSVMLFGDSEWAFRLPSAVVGTLCIPLAYLLGRAYLRPSLNLGFAAAIALLPSFIEISQIARMYGFLVLFVLLFLLALCWWERRPDWQALAGMIAAAVLGLQIQPLAILLLPLIAVPLLADFSIKRLLQAGMAVCAICWAYLVFDRWAGGHYGETMLSGNPNAARHPNPLDMAGIHNLPAELLFGVLVLVAASAVALTWSMRRRRVPGPAADVPDRVFMLLGSLGLLTAVVAAAVVSYLVAVLALCVGTACYLHGGGVIRTVMLATVAVAVIFLGQAVVLLIGEAVAGPGAFIKVFIAFPSPVPEIRFLQFFPAAVVVFGLLCAVDLFRFARGEPLPRYVLLFGFGVLAPLLVLGVVVWSVAPRFLIGLVPVFLFCLFLCVEGYLRCLPRRLLRHEGIAALAVVVLLVPPGALGDAMSRTYGPYPDHKGAAEFMRERAAEPADIVIALDASIQTHFLGRVDYWLRHIDSAGFFSREVDGQVVEIYTGTPVLFDAEAFEHVLEQPGRGAVYVIGSGEIQGASASDYVLGEDILALFDTHGAEVVFTGRDDKTRIWLFPPGSASADAVLPTTAEPIK